MIVPDILTNPLTRPRSHYDFKVVKIEGNKFWIDTLDGNQRELTCETIDPIAFEENYKPQLKDLYIGLSMDSTMYLFTKEPIKLKWKHER